MTSPVTSTSTPRPPTVGDTEQTGSDKSAAGATDTSMFDAALNQMMQSQKKQDAHVKKIAKEHKDEAAEEDEEDGE